MGPRGKEGSQRFLPSSTLAPESGVVFLSRPRVRAPSSHSWRRGHPLAILQAAGGDSNAFELNRLQGLARGNPNISDSKGREWPLKSVE